MYHQNMKKYYAVVSGVQPGIYTDWPTTQKMTSGYPGAVFKSFSCRRDAEAFITQSTTPKVSNKNPHILPLTDRTIIYTDGSAKDGEAGYGIVIVTTNGDIIKVYGKVPYFDGMRPSNDVAELYAIYVGLSLVTGNVVLYSDSKYAVDALTTYIHNWMKNGWGAAANKELIQGTFAKIQDRKVIIEHVPAHSGITLNEEADQLANMGRTAEKMVVTRNGK